MDRYWPERVAVFIGALVGFALFVLSAVATAPTGFPDGWTDAFVSVYLMLLLKITVPIWLLLRVFDFVFLAVIRNRRHRALSP
jgi:hypothetical protein